MDPGWWRWLLLVALLFQAQPVAAAPVPPVLADATPPPKHKRSPGVRALFEAATRLYDAGKYNEALAAYLALLHRYPGHEPAMVQTARTYYRLDRYSDAAAYFGHVNLSELDPETSYEYGWTFFTVKNYDPALRAFSRVPSGHSLYDLANYYGGIAALKLKRFDVAEDMLEKAVVLPDKLAKSRGLYIKHVQALRLLHQQHDLARDRELERQSLATAPPKRKTKGDLEPPPSDPTPTYQGFKTIIKNTNLQYLSEQQTSNNYGIQSETYDAKVASLDVLTGPLVMLPIRSGKDRQGAAGVQLDFGGEDREFSGNEQTLWTDASDQALTRQLNQQLGNTATRSGKADGDAWIEVPLPASLWVVVGGEVSYLYGNFEKGNRIGYHRGYLDLRGRYGFGNVGIQALYKEILDASGQQILEVGQGTASVDSEILSKLILGFQTSFAQLNYVYNGSSLDGPDSIIDARLSATQLLPLNFKLKLMAAFQDQSNYLFHHVPSYSVVAADGQNYAGKISLEATPLSFLAFGASVLFNATTWSLHDNLTQPSFQVAVPNSNQDLNLWAGINLVF